MSSAFSFPIRSTSAGVISWSEITCSSRSPRRAPPPPSEPGERPRRRRRLLAQLGDVVDQLGEQLAELALVLVEDRLPLLLALERPPAVGVGAELALHLGVALLDLGRRLLERARLLVEDKLDLLVERTTRSASSSSPSRKSLYPCERKSMKILFVSSSSNAPAPPSDSWKGGGGGGGVKELRAAELRGRRRGGAHLEGGLAVVEQLDHPVERSERCGHDCGAPTDCSWEGRSLNMYPIVWKISGSSSSYCRVALDEPPAPLAAARSRRTCRSACRKPAIERYVRVSGECITFGEIICGMCVVRYVILDRVLLVAFSVMPPGRPPRHPVRHDGRRPRRHRRAAARHARPPRQAHPARAAAAPPSRPSSCARPCSAARWPRSRSTARATGASACLKVCGGGGACAQNCGGRGACARAWERERSAAAGCIPPVLNVSREID